MLLLLWLFTRLGCLGANTGNENFIVLSMYLYGIPDGIPVTPATCTLFYSILRNQVNAIPLHCACKNLLCSRNSPQPCLDPPKPKGHDGQRQINEAEKCIRDNTALRTKFRGGVPRGCVNSIHLWPLRRDDHSGFLTGAGGMRRSDRPSRRFSNDLSMRIDRQLAREERSIARGQR